MQLGNVRQFHNIQRPLLQSKDQQPGGPPPEQPHGDGWCTAGKAGAAIISAAGLGYAGFHGGAMAGGLLGLMLTQPGAGLGNPGLLGNIVTGLQVGAISGAIIGAAGGASLVYLIADLLKSE